MRWFCRYFTRTQKLVLQKRKLNLLWSLPGFLYLRENENTPVKPKPSISKFEQLKESGKYSELLRTLTDSSEKVELSDFEYNCLLSYAYVKSALTGEDESSIDLTDTEVSTRENTFAFKAQKGLEHAEKAYELNPSSSESNKLMGICLSAFHVRSITRRYYLAKIINFLETSVELNDNDWEAHHYLGSHYLETIKTSFVMAKFIDYFILRIPWVKYDKPMHHLLRSEELKPNGSCHNLTKLAVLYYKQSDYENAKLFIEKAVNFKCRNNQDIREKQDAVKVLDGWMSYTQFFKTVNIE